MSLLELCLLDGKEGIRGKIDEKDNVEKFAVYDSINIVCGKTLKSVYGHHVYYDLTLEGSEYKDEICSLSSNLKFKGRGQRMTPCMSIRGLQRLLMMLGGKVAAQYRALVETTFSRVIAGDRSLIKVIEANAESTAPINQAFRAALVNDPLPGDDALDQMTLNRKRRYEDLEYNERLEALELKRAERIRIQMDLYRALSPGGVIDSRAELLFRDSVLNGYLSQIQGNGALRVADSDDNMPVTLSNIAADMGLKFSSNDYISIGTKVKAAYVKKYGTEPAKHDQLCGGAVRKICSYTKKDIELIQEVLRAHAGLK
jgi:hypothetical protein